LEETLPDERWPVKRPNEIALRCPKGIGSHEKTGLRILVCFDPSNYKGKDN
jgi:hypothetical protein